MYSLPKPGYDLETLRAVALAYRRERQAGQVEKYEARRRVARG